MGIRKLETSGKKIASFLALDKPELYTSHCFRRSSVTRYADNGANETELCR